LILPVKDPPQPIRVALIAPALAVRLGLRAMLAECPAIEVTAEAIALEELEVDLETVDILLAVDETPKFESLETAGEAGPAVLLLSDEPQNALALKDASLPAWGVLPTGVEIDEIQAAIQALYAGLWVGDPVLMPQLLVGGAPAQEIESDTLTNRELEVLEGLSQGLANKQIALVLGISEHTVKFHVSSIYTKLGATNRAEAVRIGIQKGWVSL